jgi:iron uptake system EfeUOB component EfeO/EfeM
MSLVKEMLIKKICPLAVLLGIIICGCSVSGGSSSSKAVKVKITDTAIEIPSTLSKGENSFEIVNESSKNCNLALKPEEPVFPYQEAPAGITSQWTVELQPGSYKTSCFIDPEVILNNKTNEYLSIRGPIVTVN